MKDRERKQQKELKDFFDEEKELPEWVLEFEKNMRKFDK